MELVQDLWSMYVFARFESDRRKIVAVMLLTTRIIACDHENALKNGQNYKSMNIEKTGT